ncbi:short-chain dehydrogenase [Marinicella pacifica]|jgi:NAD(P)-dependent dehydrogenase (short-subunit alcohol dehydrogenase family)|uniref:Short-chain dehydrogenase n=1 Tax=Marinicella pacifica TaxID=1171543 RepID=A0A917CKA5_9GAMM|nr:glucose 1-dehydrogenase [Marinicella pacifica]GGF91078.1 short-chain dehydrogenase [Marinicella pacifica]
MYDFNKKVVVITGASRGIGETAAHQFAKAGATVVVSSRKQDSIDQVAEDIRKLGGKTHAIVCHNGDKTSRERLISQVVEQCGRIDVLINNAAANPYFGPVLDTGYDAMKKTIEVNIEGYFHLSQLAGQQMKKQGSGVIINTASVNGADPAPMQGIYSVTKTAIMAMTRSFAKECAAHGIRVNAVLPGLTDTKFASALTQNEAMLKMILPQIPMGRMAQPEEIAPAYLFLASDQAGYITGVNLPVDGGFLA